MINTNNKYRLTDVAVFPYFVTLDNDDHFFRSSNNSASLFRLIKWFKVRAHDDD